ncbi:MAG: ceramidase domain-containing protein [Alphaproteobacteria bacterium]
MFDFIDIYCERLGPGFWAEPVNALTNISFFIAALFAFRLAWQSKVLHFKTGVLIALTAAMGIGSFLFHTFATGWAELADVLPILLYQICVIAFYANDIIRLKKVQTAALLGLFFFTVYLSGFIPNSVLNGSLMYAPAILFLGGLAVWHWSHAQIEKFGLFLALGVFLVSITFRSIDMQMCAAFPMGLHFLWHILNGGLLYLTTRAYVLNSQR